MTICDGKGVARIKHYKEREKQTGQNASELDAFYAMKCPECFLAYFEDFLSLNKRRTYTNEGIPLLFSWDDIAGWHRLHSLEENKYRTLVFDICDEEWVRAWHEINKKPDKKPKK